jgi:hypothetical protein
MTDAQRSDRPADRVEHAAGAPPVESGPGRISAPECVTPGGASQAIPRTRPVAPAVSRTTSDQLARIARKLSLRDKQILRSVADHRFLTTTQLQAFHFDDHASSASAERVCRRVMARLAELRIIEHLERRIGGVRAGSASFVWRVGLIGDQLLRLDTDHGVRLRRKEPSLRYLEHCLAVADVHLALLEAHRKARFELLRVDTEPGCWRDYLGPGGARETLKPDLFAVTAAGEYEDHWFIEVDRATESIPTVLRKCSQYETYRRTGREREVFPLVLWIVPHDIRADRISDALTTATGINKALFRIATTDGFLTAITGVTS